jgi:hypothetical protein
MKACVDEGTLQAYLDGELEAARAGEVAAHVAACETCAATVHEATDQFALLSSALGTSETLSVPTERLRARIDASIAELQPTRGASPIASTSFVECLRAFASSLAAQFASAPRQATAFASLFVAALLLASIFYIFRPQSRTPQDGQSGAGEIAKVKPPMNEGETGGQRGAGDTGAGGGEIKEAASEGERGVKNLLPRRVTREGAGSVGFTEANFTRAGNARGSASRAADADVSDAALLPVEKSYASAIASLKFLIDQQKARSMSPTLRAEYERNVAVVDRAIDASRAAARRDPSDKDAQEFLRAAYQGKLELLRAVADQAQIASIGR